MKSRIRKRLDKKERSAKARAEEKNQKFHYRKMLQEYICGGGRAEEAYLKPEEMQDLYPENEEFDIDSQGEYACADTEAEEYEKDHSFSDDLSSALTEDDDGLFDIGKSEGYDEDEIGNLDSIPVSFWSLFVVGGLGLLLVIFLSAYAGIMIAGKDADKQTEMILSETEKETGAETETEENVLTWISDIFGEESIPGNLEVPAIYGLSERTQKRLGFDRETFSSAASSFLKKNGIETELIYLEKTIPVSSEEAVGYIASMAGIADSKLEVIFYPEYEGHYIFMLTEKETSEEVTVETEKGREQDTPSSETAAQPESTSGSVTAEQRETKVVYQTTTVDENTYDADRLKITSIPSELKNYISNEYLLQYQLYDYLYNKGMRSVRSAKVTEYSIDGDVRQAVFRLGLDNGQTVSCTYYHDSGAFSFS